MRGRPRRPPRARARVVELAKDGAIRGISADLKQTLDGARTVGREHLLGKFHLDPEATGVMPLGADSVDSAQRRPWDGVALAVILVKGAIPQSKWRAGSLAQS